MLAHRGQAGGRARADHVHLVRRGGRVRSAAGHRSGWRDQCAGARAEVLRAMMGSSGAHEGMRGQMSGPGGDAPPFDDPPPPPSQVSAIIFPIIGTDCSRSAHDFLVAS